MRPVSSTGLLSVACAGLVLGVGLTFTYYENRNVGSSLDQSDTVQALANEIGELRGHQTVISDRIDRLATEVTASRQRSASARQSDNDESLVSRVEKLELHYASANAMLATKAEHPTTVEMIEQLNAQSAAGLSRSNARAEALYQSDYGAGDDYTTGLITQTFERAADLNIQSIQCKSTICRVSYSSASPQEQSSGWHPEADFILSQLSDELGGSSVTAHHSRDAQGNNIMYVNLYSNFSR